VSAKSITIRRLPTLDACLATHLPPEVLADPEDWEMGAVLSSGGELVACSSRADEFIGLVREHCPCWGHCRTATGEIHVWIGSEATDADALFLLGHELGHLEAIAASDDPDVAEERRADSYGRVASAALTIWRAFQAGEMEISMERGE
jgi:hypothetical protein